MGQLMLLFYGDQLEGRRYIGLRKNSLFTKDRANKECMLYL